MERDDDKDIRNEIISVDWTKYVGPDYYDPRRAAKALIDLLELDSSERAEEICNNVINALGNNHAGAYYPAVLSAIDIIISMAQDSSDNKVRKVCAFSILNNLYYFEPELGSYSGNTYDEIRTLVRHKLEPFSD